VLYWSKSPRSGSSDALTSFGLGLLNSPVFPGWFGVIDAAGHARAAFHLPPIAGGIVSLSVHTHQLYLTRDFRLAGTGSAFLTSRIRR